MKALCWNCGDEVRVLAGDVYAPHGSCRCGGQPVPTLVVVGSKLQAGDFYRTHEGLVGFTTMDGTLLTAHRQRACGPYWRFPKGRYCLQNGAAGHCRAANCPRRVGIQCRRCPLPVALPAEFFRQHDHEHDPKKALS